MPTPSPKVLAFAGSTRQQSFNKKLVRIAADLAREAGADVTFIDLKVYPLPLYDGDLEEEIVLPENAVKIREMMKSHQGFLIASPEYNSSISGVLKNTIDWASRPQPLEEPLVCFKNKIVTLMSASPGGLGGIRGLATVRSILSNIGALVLPNQVAIPKANEKLSADGYLIEDKDQTMMEDMIIDFMAVLKKII